MHTRTNTSCMTSSTRNYGRQEQAKLSCENRRVLCCTISPQRTAIVSGSWARTKPSSAAGIDNLVPASITLYLRVYRTANNKIPKQTLRCAQRAPDPKLQPCIALPSSVACSPASDNLESPRRFIDRHRCPRCGRQRCSRQDTVCPTTSHTCCRCCCRCSPVAPLLYALKSNNSINVHTSNQAQARRERERALANQEDRSGREKK